MGKRIALTTPKPQLLQEKGVEGKGLLGEGAGVGRGPANL